MSRPSPLDALTALVIFAQAPPDAMLSISWGPYTTHRSRRYCRRHAVQREYNDMTKGNAKRQPMTMMDEMIAEDRITNALRLGKFTLWRTPTTPAWHECVHCRMQAAERHRA